jgi:hypothetical protein
MRVPCTKPKIQILDSDADRKRALLITNKCTNPLTAWQDKGDSFGFIGTSALQVAPYTYI